VGPLAVGPVGPVAPVPEDVPGSPVGPEGPVGPVLPVAPVGPVWMGRRGPLPGSLSRGKTPVTEDGTIF